MQTNSIGFPGLGLGPFTINTVAFNVFGRDIAWYGIFVTIGILSGIFYAFWRGQKNNGISIDDMIDIAIFSIPAAIIGARLYYIVFNLQAFPTLRSAVAIWNGGLAVYGGIIFGLASGLAVCKFKKLSVLKVFDSAAPAIMLGQVIGRWGNFTNAEAYGSKTDLPWRMSINQNLQVHPTFLYESLWNLLGFIIINLIYKKKKFDGHIFLMYITWYGFGRMLIEGLRVDSLWIINEDIRVSQILGFLCFVVGTVLLIMLTSKSKLQNLENEAYEGVYSSTINKTNNINNTDNTEETFPGESNESDSNAADTHDGKTVDETNANADIEETVNDNDDNTVNNNGAEESDENDKNN